MELVGAFAHLVIEDQNRQLVVVASTFMANNRECVIAWSEEENRLLRPVTNLERNSWRFGTFNVGCHYQFGIVNLNPAQAIWPHKTEDTLVRNDNPVQVDRPRYTENEMYNMLFDSSVETVAGVFAPGVIQGGRYITERTECPSAGILRCTLKDIDLYWRPNARNQLSMRCRITKNLINFDFPVKAQNQDELMQRFQEPANDAPPNILVLLGLGRPFAGDNNRFHPRRCYIMVIDVIMQ